MLSAQVRFCAPCHQARAATLRPPPCVGAPMPAGSTPALCQQSSLQPPQPQQRGAACPLQVIADADHCLVVELRAWGQVHRCTPAARCAYACTPTARCAPYICFLPNLLSRLATATHTPHRRMRLRCACMCCTPDSDCCGPRRGLCVGGSAERRSTDGAPAAEGAAGAAELGEGQPQVSLFSGMVSSEAMGNAFKKAREPPQLCPPPPPPGGLFPAAIRCSAPQCCCGAPH